MHIASPGPKAAGFWDQSECPCSEFLVDNLANSKVGFNVMSSLANIKEKYPAMVRMKRLPSPKKITKATSTKLPSHRKGIYLFPHLVSLNSFRTSNIVDAFKYLSFDSANASHCITPPKTPKIKPTITTMNEWGAEIKVAKPARAPQSSIITCLLTV
ncbi:hypothetical protein D1BOALGB6SA_10627 [Olavius sp. associated proteobacterium Delta 1]|nr:hypothetical protein D1BOALGB6SA_10627 [Olavius sp. associated proteobacterium Delta 1]